ncbi:MAG TPA: SRPBCC family protein [Candidatus Acidoferrum sp.]|nr:SRPBCC family protein [Candidatus Acidoferrum sp.]
MKPRHSTTEEGTSLVHEHVPARRSRPSVHGNKGTRVEKVVTINRRPEELFSFWRNFENLPRVMEHIESVECQDRRRSHWRLRWPKNKVVEWDAEIINEHPNELIAWRTLEGSDVQHAGSIRFTPAPGARGTEVKLAVEYETSKFANFLAKVFRRSPEQQIEEDLRRFKQLMEGGETTAAQ